MALVREAKPEIVICQDPGWRRLRHHPDHPNRVVEVVDVYHRKEAAML